jgi:hypothetical protein
MSYDTLNQYPKESKTEPSLRTTFCWLFHKSCCNGIGWAVWHLYSPSIQISARSSTNCAPYTCCRTNHPYDNQNSQKCSLKASDLCANKRSDYWRNCWACSVNLFERKRISWLILSRKIVRFIWSMLLIVYWKQNLSRPIIFLFQVIVVVWESNRN